jgi:phytol kinase
MLTNFENFGFILGAFGALLGGLAILRRYVPSNPEVLRKILHAGMGLVALSLPWVFTSAWPVVLLASSLVTLLIGIRVIRPLRRKLGAMIYDVGRSSWGEVYFALGVTCLFILCRNEPLLYRVPVLILALADATSSLIGKRYGRLRYKVHGGSKTVEGSVAFLLAAFLVAEVGLLLLEPLGGLDGLVVALGLALPLTLVEAAAGKGSDNFFVPVAAFVLLRGLLAMGRLELVEALAIWVLVVPGVFLFLCSRGHSAEKALPAPGAGLQALGNCL